MCVKNLTLEKLLETGISGWLKHTEKVHVERMNSMYYELANKIYVILCNGHMLSSNSDSK